MNHTVGDTQLHQLCWLPGAIKIFPLNRVFFKICGSEVLDLEFCIEDGHTINAFAT